MPLLCTAIIWKLELLILIYFYQNEDTGFFFSIRIFFVMVALSDADNSFVGTVNCHGTAVWQGLDGVWLFDFCMWVL